MKISKPPAPLRPARAKPTASPQFRPESVLIPTQEAFDTASVTTVAASGQAGPVASVDAVLALQGGQTALAQTLERGEQLLDLLDAVRVDVLNGEGAREHLVALREALKATRRETHDAGLEAAIDAIELRAAVELAKRELV